jgi:hypothetical protein
MKKLISSLAILSILLVTGCADVSTVKRNDTRTASLDSKARTFITIPEDGSYGRTVYKGSGSTVSGIVLSAFAVKLLNIDLADKTLSFDDALTYARIQGYRYLISPKILHWEDRNAAWSGRPSKASIRIIIVDVKTGDVIESTVIDARSSSWRMTDPAPEDALPKPVAEYVSSLRIN